MIPLQPELVKMLRDWMPEYTEGQPLFPKLAKRKTYEMVKKDLEWWLGFLRKTAGRFAPSSRSATLVPNWGDGSGTGMGGTLGLPDKPLKMWKGK